MKLKEIVYMVLDELKGISDDFSFNEEHIIFLTDKYRALLLKQKYSNPKQEIPSSNYQEICLDLIPYETGTSCMGDLYLKSTESIPNLMTTGTPTVTPNDTFLGTNITYVSEERMRFVGHNKFLRNIIYCSKGSNGYLFLKSNNPQFLYMKQVKLKGVFENPAEALGLSCCTQENKCDVMDMEYPLESSLVPNLLELIIKDLSAAEYRITDNENNANDDLGDLATSVRQNVKSPLQKQIGL